LISKLPSKNDVEGDEQNLESRYQDNQVFPEAIKINKDSAVISPEEEPLGGVVN
jgi:hypothetical protein